MPAVTHESNANQTLGRVCGRQRKRLLTCLCFRHGEHTKECQHHGKPLAAVLHRSILTARRHGKPALLMRFAEREHSDSRVTASDQHAPHRRRESRLRSKSYSQLHWQGTQQYYARPMRWRVRLSFSLPRVALGTCTAKRTQKKLCASAQETNSVRVEWNFQTQQQINNRYWNHTTVIQQPSWPHRESSVAAMKGT